MIEVITIMVSVLFIAIGSFQLGEMRQQKRVAPELSKARADVAKYRMLLKLRPINACDVCGNGQPVGEDVDATTVENCGNCRKCYKGREWAPGVLALDRTGSVY